MNLDAAQLGVEQSVWASSSTDPTSLFVGMRELAYSCKQIWRVGGEVVELVVVWQLELRLQQEKQVLPGAVWQIADLKVPAEAVLEGGFL